MSLNMKYIVFVVTVLEVQYVRIGYLLKSY